MAEFTKYEHDGHIFEVYEPKNYQMVVKSNGMPDGKITIHEQTGMFREDVLGWGSDCATLDEAIVRVCIRMIERSKQDSIDTKRKKMNDFYSNLKDKNT